MTPSDERIADAVRETLLDRHRREPADDGLATRLLDAVPARVTRRSGAGRRSMSGLFTVAAACVVVALVAALAVVLARRSGRSAPGVQPTAPVVSTSTSSPVAPPHPLRTSTPPPFGPAVTGGLLLRGARIALAPGWTARADRVTPAAWGSASCLERRGAPVPARLADCAAWIRALPEAPSSRIVQAVYAGTLPGSRCTDPAAGVNRIATRVGGRAAERLTWRPGCTDRRGRIAEYVVGTAPGFVLYTRRVTPAVDVLLRVLTTASVLPARIAKLPYYVKGVVSERSDDRSGYTIAVSPTVPDSLTKLSGARPVVVFVPVGLLPRAAAVTLTGPVSVTTDGQRVTGVSILG